MAIILFSSVDEPFLAGERLRSGRSIVPLVGDVFPSSQYVSPPKAVSNILRSAAAIFAVQSCTCLAACSGGDYEPLERSPRRRSPVRRIGAPRVVNALS